MDDTRTTVYRDAESDESDKPSINAELTFVNFSMGH